MKARVFTMVAAAGALAIVARTRRTLESDQRDPWTLMVRLR